MVRTDADQRGERVDAVLALKSSLDTSSARINAQNVVRRRQAEQLAEQDARAHETLLSQGLNPYEVTRRREVTQQAARERSMIERNISDKQAKVLQHLKVERVQQQRREKIAAENRAYEKKYQREMGRAAAEERVQAYLVSLTGKETLDPTGKAVRIYSSQEAPLKDNSFGLGKSLVHTSEQRKRMIEKVRDKTALHRETGPSSMLLPRQSSVSSDPDEAERETHQSHSLPALRPSSPPVSEYLATASTRPGEDLRALNHALVSHSSDSLQVKLPPLGSSQPSNQRQQSPDLSSQSGTSKKQRSRSILEQKMLDNARKRQRETAYSNKQVVWGREFAGDAFRADPPALWFKDFDVGTPLTLSLTLTNVSNTFNQFKLLDVEDEGVRELFEIKYERPGRMSAGMTCGLTITFTGDRREDIDTWLPVAAPTGVTRVPIKCTCKKAVPVLSATCVRFEDVVAGDSRSIALTLENRGALPFTFRVKRMPPVRENEITEVESSSVCGSSSSDHGDQKQSESGLAAEENPQETEMDPVDSGGSSEDKTESSSNSVMDGEDMERACLPSDGSPLPLPPSPLNEAVSDLSEEELQLIKHAQSLTRYEPPGFDTPITFKECGVVPPYSSVPVTFTFCPAAPMRTDDLQFSLDFYKKRPDVSSSADSHVDDGARSAARSITDDDDEEIGRISSVVATVSAQSTDVPIFVADELINLQCCAYGKLYRAQILIGNRGKIALKMQIKPPKALADVVEFHPSEGYVQAGAIAGATTKNADDSAEGSSFMVVQVKFRPTTDMWKRIERRGLGSQALGMLAVPIRVLVPDQRVPVFVTLVARITSSDLKLSPGTLLFGDCCVGHSISRSLTITNCARVPQRIAAVTRPPEVGVLNDDREVDGCADGGDLAGAGIVLLPLESRRFKVVYEPTSALPLVSNARPPATTIKTTSTGMVKPTIPPPPPTPLLVIQSATFNRSYSLVCSGLGVKSPLAFSQTVVLMGATQLGQMQLTSIFCANESDQQQQFEFRLPPEASKGSQPLLRITPTVATLAPRQRMRIELEFFAHEDVFELANRPFGAESASENSEQVQTSNTDTSDAGSDSGPSSIAQEASVDAPSVRVSTSRSDLIGPRTTSWELSVPRGYGGISDPKPSRTAQQPSWALGIPAEPRSCHVTWTILCFRRVDPVSHDGKKTPRSTKADAFNLPIQSLTVQSTVLAAPRVRLSAQSLNFGQVALGQATRLALTFTNDGDRDLQLRARALHALGAFRVINSTQRLIQRGGGALDLHIEFAPQSPVEFEDELELLDVDARAKCPVLRVSLRGRGVNPSLVIEPHDGVLDFKDVLARSCSVQELTLTNASGFPLKFSIAAWSDAPRAVGLGVSAVSGLPMFSFLPSEGTIPAQASLTVKVAFHPDHSRPNHYSQRFRIYVPNESERHLLSLSGRCWENQLYVFAPGASVNNAVEVLADQVIVPPPKVSPAIEDLFDLPLSVSIASLLKSALSPPMALAKPPTTITVTFGDGQANGGDTRRFFVGSTLPLITTASSATDSDVTKAAAAGVFSFELAVDGDSPHAKLFALEPLKGSLSPGQQLAVTATFRPPTQQKDGNAAGTGSAALTALFPSASGPTRPEIRVSQWVELRVTCTLRGGAMWRQTAVAAAPATSAPPAAGKAAVQSGEAGDARVVTLVLRAKLHV